MKVINKNNFMKDSKHLDWIYERLVHVHKENELYKYMHKFRKIINKMKAQESNFVDDFNRIDTITK